MKCARRQDETAALTRVVLTGTGSAFSAAVDTKIYLTYQRINAAT
jgi:hypothetical protein